MFTVDVKQQSNMVLKVFEPLKHNCIHNGENINVKNMKIGLVFKLEQAELSCLVRRNFFASFAKTS